MVNITIIPRLIHYIIFSVLLLYACSAAREGNTSLHSKRLSFPSKQVGDSFDIHITLPPGYDSTQENYPVIYYMDANLKSGKKLRSIIDELSKKDKAVKAVFVGVGHFSNYRVLRRRDFITPFIKDKRDSLISDDKNFGQSEHFYLFMKQELIPYMEKHYRVTVNRSYIGHSLGGLFAFYCLFRKERLFNNIVSLSPALWINHGNIYEFEKRYYQDSSSLHANLFLCVGGQERFNFILNGSRDMHSFLQQRNYHGLQFTYHEFEGESHNSEVPLALTMILPRL